MSKLSLPTRKNIQEFEAKRTANLQKIFDATGIQFDVDVDFLAVAPLVEARGYKDRAGEVIYEAYLGGLANNISTFVQNDLQKEGFVDTFKEKHTITFVFEDKLGEESPTSTKYVWVTNNAGVLQVHVPKAEIWSAVNRTGCDLIKACSGDNPLSIDTRNNISKFSANLADHLKSIKTASDIDFDVKFDWVALDAAAAGRGYPGRVGEAMYNEYIKGLASNIGTFCNDSLQKEAFQETFKEKHTITAVLEDKLGENSATTSKYVWLVNNDGVLEIHIPRAEFWCATNYTGCDLINVCE